MNRYLKNLGLALVSVLVIGAVAASMASAQGKFTSTGPVTLIGTLTGTESENALTAFGFTIACPAATYTGHKLNATPHELVPNGATAITVTPNYGACRLFATGLGATVDMNGCDYVLDLENTTGGADEYLVRFTITCPSNQHIKLTMFTNVSHSEANHFCDVTITENILGKVGLRAKGTTNGTFDIVGAVGSFEADKAAGPDKGILCPASETMNALLDIDITVSGRNASGGATSIGLSD